MEAESVTVATEGIVPTDDTGRWHAVEVGAGFPVVFVHDLFGVCGVWDAVVEVLSGDWRCVAVDLPGHGQSGCLPPGSSPVTLAGDLGDVLETFGAAPAALVGHGFGALVTLRLALERPAAVSGLVLVAPRVGTSASATNLVRRWAEEGGDFVDVYFPTLFAEKFFLDQPGRAHTEREALATIDPLRLETLAVALDADSDALASLGDVQVPTLVVAGALDECVPVGGVTASGQAAGLDVETFPGCGHMLPLEAPVELAQAIASILDML